MGNELAIEQGDDGAATATLHSLVDGRPAPANPAGAKNAAQVIAFEQAVIARLQAGDARPYGWLVERHRPRVRAILARMIDHHHDVDDLVQQTFVSAWGALASFDAGRPFGAWVNRIAINLAKDYLKSKRRSETHLVSDAVTSRGADPEELAAAREAVAALGRALERLTAGDREVLVLKAVEDLPYAEMTRLLRRPVGALKIRVVRARHRLLAQLALGAK